MAKPKNETDNPLGFLDSPVPVETPADNGGGIDLGTPEQYVERVNPVEGLVEQVKKARKPRTSKLGELERLEREFECSTDSGARLDLAIEAIGILNAEQKKIVTLIERNQTLKSIWRERYKESTLLDFDKVKE